MLSYILTVVMLVGLVGMSLAQRHATKRALSKVDHEDVAKT